MSQQLAPINRFQQTIAAQSTKLQSMLPPHIDVRRFQRAAVTAAQSNPDILRCDPDSVIQACMAAAKDGLLVDGKEAAIVPFKGRASYIPMVQGIIKRLRNSGRVTAIDAILVHKNDAFRYNPGTMDAPDHEPDWFGDRGDVIGVYAVARMKDGSTQVEIMGRDQIENIRQKSMGKNAGPWRDHWDEMARKTVIRRIAKYLPSSSERDDDERVDRLLDRGVDYTEVDPEPEPISRPSGATAALGRIAAQCAPKAPPQTEADTPADLETGEVYDESSPPPHNGEAEQTEAF